MGIFDRLLGGGSLYDDPDATDPNPVISGTPARARIVKGGNYSIGGDGSSTARWSKKEFAVTVIDADPELTGRVVCHLSHRAFLRASVGTEVPVLLDAGGIAGLDVAAWEAEVVELDRVNAPPGGSSGATVAATDDRELAATQLDAIEGVDFDTYVAVEAALATEAIVPAGHDARAAELGVPAGKWSAVQAGWQQRMRADWKLSTRFGELYGDLTGR